MAGSIAPSPPLRSTHMAHQSVAIAAEFGRRPHAARVKHRKQPSERLARAMGACFPTHPHLHMCLPARAGLPTAPPLALPGCRPPGTRHTQ
jgi:hypothetical protein